MKRSKGYMDAGLFEKITGELGPYLYNMNLYFQGEPMLHPQFFSFIERAGGIRTMISTNGHFLAGENAEKIVNSGLKELVVSLDGMDQKTYSSYRVNGDLEKVINGIKDVSEAKKRYSSKMKLEIQFLVNRFNENQVPVIRNFARKTRAYLKLKSMQIKNPKECDSWLPSSKKFRRYELQDNEYISKNRLPNRCPRLWFNPVISWEGKVLPCCFDKDADHIMGDLKEDSFREIWNGPKYRSFRKSLLSGRFMIDICRNCTSGLTGVNC
jgi:radical SAM protein with 4Fe4S-binding SPASM domain